MYKVLTKILKQIFDRVLWCRFRCSEVLMESLTSCSMGFRTSWLVLYFTGDSGFNLTGYKKILK